MAKKKALFMTALLAVAFGLTALVALLADKKEYAEERVCVTSFYPVYLLADAVAEGVDGVTVQNLTENHSGCLHDYTLTTKDMRLLARAELLLINGGEMELFLTKTADDYENLTIVNTSEGYQFLEGVEHSHDHDEDKEQEAHDHEHEHEHEHESEAVSEVEHHHAVNGHLWLDIDGYLLQLSAVEEALVKMNPAGEAGYRENAAACRKELSALKEEFSLAKQKLAGIETVVFHEGFVYLLRMLGMEAVHCLAMDADTQISAGEAAEIVEECKLHGIAVLFAEAEYVDNISETFGGETESVVVALDALTGGEKSETPIMTYCNGMRNNLNAILQAYGLQ